MRMLLLLLVFARAGAAQDLATASGAPFSLDGVLARGPAVLVFWNTWLPESARFLPVIQDADAAAAGGSLSGAVVIFQDDEAAIRRVGEGPAGLPRVVDRRGVLLRRFQVTKAPTVLVVDRNGAVLARSGPDPVQAAAALALAQRR